MVPEKKTMYHTVNTEHGPCILPWKIDVSWYKIQTCIPTGVTLKCGMCFNVLFSHNSRWLYMYIMHMVTGYTKYASAYNFHIMIFPFAYQAIVLDSSDFIN